jgi:hypothetical protein
MHLFYVCLLGRVTVQHNAIGLQTRGEILQKLGSLAAFSQLVIKRQHQVKQAFRALRQKKFSTNA